MSRRWPSNAPSRALSSVDDGRRARVAPRVVHGIRRSPVQRVTGICVAATRGDAGPRSYTSVSSGTTESAYRDVMGMAPMAMAFMTDTQPVSG